MLVEIVADRVESLCGFKPDPDMVAKFLKEFVAGHIVPPLAATKPAGQAVPRSSPSPTPSASNPSGKPASTPAPRSAPVQQTTPVSHDQVGFSFEGKFHAARNAIDTLKQVFDLFIKRDPTFGDRFAGLPKHGRTRRYLARDANELYGNRPDLVRECSIRLDSGWWMGTNYGKRSIGQIITMACEVAQVACGRDLIHSLGD